MVEVHIVDGPTTRELRRAVLRPGWPVGAAMHGDDNPDAIHLAVLLDEDVVGACLVLPRAYPLRPELVGAWQLRGMATAPAMQGRGIGSAVLGRAVDEVRSRGGRLLWCDARTTAVAFYRAHGFAAEGSEFVHEESGIRHYRMWRAL